MAGRLRAVTSRTTSGRSPAGTAISVTETGRVRFSGCETACGHFAPGSSRTVHLAGEGGPARTGGSAGCTARRRASATLAAGIARIARIEAAWAEPVGPRPHRTFRAVLEELAINTGQGGGAVDDAAQVAARRAHRTCRRTTCRGARRRTTSATSAGAKRTSSEPWRHGGHPRRPVAARRALEARRRASSRAGRACRRRPGRAAGRAPRAQPDLGDPGVAAPRARGESARSTSRALTLPEPSQTELSGASR